MKNMEFDSIKYQKKKSAYSRVTNTSKLVVHSDVATSIRVMFLFLMLSGQSGTIAEKAQIAR